MQEGSGGEAEVCEIARVMEYAPAKKSTEESERTNLCALCDMHISVETQVFTWYRYSL